MTEETKQQYRVYFNGGSLDGVGTVIDFYPSNGLSHITSVLSPSGKCVAEVYGLLGETREFVTDIPIWAYQYQGQKEVNA